MSHTVQQPNVANYNNWLPSGAGERNSTSNSYKDAINDILCMHGAGEDYGANWSTFDPNTDLPASPPNYRSVVRYNSNNQEARIYTYTPSGWKFRSISDSSGIGATSMSELSDVSLSGLADGQVLGYTGAQWENRSFIRMDHIEVAPSAQNAVLSLHNSTTNTYKSRIELMESPNAYAWDEANAYGMGWEYDGSGNQIKLKSTNNGVETTQITINRDSGETLFQGTVTVPNLIVNGTLTTINSETVTIDDPIFTLGGDTAPTVDDSKDRGIEFRWHNGSVAKTGFFGFDRSTQRLTYIPDGTNTSEVYSGALGDMDIGTIYSQSLFVDDGASGANIELRSSGSGESRLIMGGSGTIAGIGGNFNITGSAGDTIISSSSGSVQIADNLIFDAGTRTIAGIQADNLVDKSAIETISALWTFGSGIDLSTSNISNVGNITFSASTNTIAGIQNQNLLDKTVAEVASGRFNFTTGLTIGGTDSTDAKLNINDSSAILARFRSTTAGGLAYVRLQGKKTDSSARYADIAINADGEYMELGYGSSSPTLPQVDGFGLRIFDSGSVRINSSAGTIGTTALTTANAHFNIGDNLYFDDNEITGLGTWFIYAQTQLNIGAGGANNRLSVSASGIQLGGANASVTTILDEDDFNSNSDTALATQQSIKTYVDNIISAQDDFDEGLNRTITGQWLFNTGATGTSPLQIGQSTSIHKFDISSPADHQGLMRFIGLDALGGQPTSYTFDILNNDQEVWYSFQDNSADMLVIETYSGDTVINWGSKGSGNNLYYDSTEKRFGFKYGGSSIWHIDADTGMSLSGAVVNADYYNVSTNQLETATGTYSASKIAYRFNEARGLNYNSFDDAIYFAMADGVPMAVDNAGTIYLGGTTAHQGGTPFVTITGSSLTASGSLLANGDDVIASQPFTANAGATISGGTLIAGATTLSGLLDVNANADVSGTLTVGDTSQFDRIFSSNVDSNLLEHTWVIDADGSGITGYTRNGSATENEIVMASQNSHPDAPDGRAGALLWHGESDGDNSSHGGFLTDTYTVSLSDSIRFSVWMYIVDKGDANFYFGIRGTVLNMDGTTNSNAYFSGGLESSTNTGEWYLLVGYLHGISTVATTGSHGGVYRASTGEKVASLDDFKVAQSVSLGLRAFHFYDSSGNSEVYYYAPRMDILDGTEQSIASILGRSPEGNNMGTRTLTWESMNGTTALNIANGDIIGINWLKLNDIEEGLQFGGTNGNTPISLIATDTNTITLKGYTGAGKVDFRLQNDDNTFDFYVQDGTAWLTTVESTTINASGTIYGGDIDADKGTFSDGDTTTSYGTGSTETLLLGVNGTNSARASIKMWGRTNNAFGFIQMTTSNLHLDATGSIYMNWYTSGDTYFKNQVQIQGTDSNKIILDNTTAGSPANYILFKDTGGDTAYVGHGSAGNDYLYLTSYTSSVIVNANGGTNDVSLVGLNINLGNSEASQTKMRIVRGTNKTSLYTLDSSNNYGDLHLGRVDGSSGALTYDASLSRWGIGDSTPTYTLDINGTLRATGNFYANSTAYITNLDVTTITDSYTATGNVTMTGDVTIGNSSADYLYFSDGSTPNVGFSHYSSTSAVLRARRSTGTWYWYDGSITSYLGGASTSYAFDYVYGEEVWDQNGILGNWSGSNKLREHIDNLSDETHQYLVPHFVKIGDKIQINAERILDHTIEIALLKQEIKQLKQELMIKA